METATTSTTVPAGQTEAEKIGSFFVQYHVGNDLPGSVTAKLSFVVNVVSHHVTGYGAISQAILPKPDFTTHFVGSYSYLTLLPAPEQIVLTATGYPVIDWPHHGGIGPVLPANAKLHMLLSKDWESGIATLRYFDNGKWQELENVPVKRIN